MKTGARMSSPQAEAERGEAKGAEPKDTCQTLWSCRKSVCEAFSFSFAITAAPPTPVAL